MTDPLVFPASREPIATIGGQLTRVWGRFLGQLYDRLGWGATTVYKDAPAAYTGTANVNLASLVSRVDLIEMPNAASSTILGRVRVPNDAIPGESVTLFFEWVPSTDMGSNEIQIRFEYLVLRVGATAIEGFSLDEYGGGDADVTVRTAAVTLDSINPGDTIAIEIDREGAAGADTFGGAILVASFGVIYAANGIGGFDKFP